MALFKTGIISNYKISRCIIPQHFLIHPSMLLVSTVHYFIEISSYAASRGLTGRILSASPNFFDKNSSFLFRHDKSDESSSEIVASKATQETKKATIWRWFDSSKALELMKLPSWKIVFFVVLACH